MKPASQDQSRPAQSSKLCPSHRLFHIIYPFIEFGRGKGHLSILANQLIISLGPPAARAASASLFAALFGAVPDACSVRCRVLARAHHLCAQKVTEQIFCQK